MNEVSRTTPTRIFVDVTETIHLDLRTGIQRVVREITRKDTAANGAFELVPVVAIRGQFFELSEQGYRQLRAPGRAHFVEPTPYRAPLAFRIIRTILSPFPKLVLGARRWQATRRFERGLEAYAGEKVFPVRGDRVVLADTYYQSSAVRAGRAARRHGAALIVVTYDLIPVQYPQLMEENFLAYFRDKVPPTMARSDGVLTISDWCVDELRKFGVTVPLGRFYLGYNLPTADANGNGQLAEINSSPWPPGLWNGSSPVFLMVGTIASHKGHGIALDAFERLWAQGSNCRLLMIGRPGWEMDTLIRRINEHGERNNRLFVVHDADDSMVDMAFRRSFAAINGSLVEGFGLPLVEALARGLPVIAADIPIFREIAGNSVLQFEQASPDSLADAVCTMTERREIYANLAQDFSWIDWDGARDAFAHETESLARQRGK